MNLSAYRNVLILPLQSASETLVLKVSQIILGCMSYGSSKWRPWTLNEEESMEHIKYAYETAQVDSSESYEAEIQTFDTANMYSNGMGEIVLGNTIKKLQLPREEIVVMTKVRHPVGKTLDVNSLDLFLAGPENMGYANQFGLSRKHILASVQDSLRRLQLDYIDVLQCRCYLLGFKFPLSSNHFPGHRFDYDTPIAETMEALHEVVKPDYAITHNLTPFISMQNHYNLLHREEEREMMPSLKHFGVGSIPWSPLARGEKTLRQETDETPADLYFTLGAGSKDVVDRVEESRSEAWCDDGASVRFAWLMEKDGGPELRRLSSARTSLKKLEDLLGALDLKLTPEDLAYMEEPYKPLKSVM
ncbi:Aldo/keto reductase, partial [Mycena olivaceomarginata]